MDHPPELQLLVTCLPGLERLLQAECEGLGWSAGRAVRDGVTGPADLDTMARLNLGSGLGSQVMVHLGRFRARHFGELKRCTLELRWEQWLVPGQPIRVKATCRRSKLIHSGAVAERVVESIGQRVGVVVAAADDERAIAVHVRFFEDDCTIWLDTSGAPLHRRGWRLATAKAPLREDLACAMLRASGWSPADPLADPFCGSGTIAIEAARIARGAAPGAGRRFAFEQFAGFDAARWTAMRAGFGGDTSPAPGSIVGTDRDPGAIEAARANAERAGVADLVRFEQAVFADAPVWTAGLDRGAVVSNPPFGQRVRGSNLVHLWQSIGHRLRSLSGDWRVALLAADRRLALRSGLALRRGFTANHGGQQVTAWLASAAAGGEQLDDPVDG